MRKRLVLGTALLAALACQAEHPVAQLAPSPTELSPLGAGEPPSADPWGWPEGTQFEDGLQFTEGDGHLLDNLRQFIREERGSYHRLLRKCFHLMRRQATGRSWTAVRRQFEAAGLPPVRDTRSWKPDASYRIEGAFETQSGAPHDLELWVFTDAKDRISWIRCSLASQQTEDFEAAVGRLGYRSGSAAALALTHDRLREIAAAYPLLTLVRIEYGSAGDRWARFNPLQLTVNIELERDASSPSGGTYVGVSFTSGMDPPISWSGNRQLAPKGFRRRETLGEPQVRQHNWWAGRSPDDKAFMDEQVRLAREWEQRRR